VIAAFLALSTLAATNPKFLLKIANDIADIENHDKQGTGGWRAEQARSYWPFIEDNPIVGMRFAGFELPIQFYDPDQPKLVVFEDGHGHFLHSYYIDSLFYLGVIGLLLLSLPQLYILYQMVRHPHVNPEALSWAVFIATSLVYGYSYALPMCFYGIVGLGFVRIRQLSDADTNSTLLIPSHVEKVSPSVPISYSA
jgi:O-antigen ligase